MPGSDGLSLIRAIRERLADVPIVMFTGAGYDEAKMKSAVDAGANGFVSKALAPSVLYASLLAALARAAESERRRVDVFISALRPLHPCGQRMADERARDAVRTLCIPRLTEPSSVVDTLLPFLMTAPFRRR